MHHPFSSRTDTKSDRVNLTEDLAALTDLGRDTWHAIAKSWKRSEVSRILQKGRRTEAAHPFSERLAGWAAPCEIFGISHAASEAQQEFGRSKTEARKKNGRVARMVEVMNRGRST